MNVANPWVAPPRQTQGMAPAQPATRRSFDIFDTLIARRCITPHAVFAEVERRSGHAGFAAQRLAAERHVEASDYTLASIYEALASQMALPPAQAQAQAQALMAQEIAVELDNVLPMADNLALLTDDALLITDMYLPHDVIRAMLAKVGVPAHLCLLRSAHGKRSGAVWAALAHSGQHCQHLGDNPLSDHARPVAAGMQAQLTAAAQPTATEQGLADAGCPHLAQTLRAARLQTRQGSLPAHLHRLQVALNLPMLTLAALHLLAHTHQGNTLLFSSRDARYLLTLYSALASSLPGPHASGHYWYTSRLARTSAQADYLHYCRQHIGSGALLVDLCGTGASVALLRAQLGIDDRTAPLFVCEAIDAPALTKTRAAQKGLHHIAPPIALWSNSRFVPNELLELLNYVPEGMVRGVCPVPGGHVPLRDPIEFEPDTLAQVQEMARFVADYAQALCQVMVPEALSEVRQHTPALCAALASAAQGLGGELAALRAAWFPAHLSRERAIAETLLTP